MAQELFRLVWRPGQPVRLIGVGISGFDDSEQQLALWGEAETDEDQRKLQAALDDLRSRFGESIIQRGSDLKRKR